MDNLSYSNKLLWQIDFSNNLFLPLFSCFFFFFLIINEVKWVKFAEIAHEYLYFATYYFDFMTQIPCIFIFQAFALKLGQVLIGIGLTAQEHWSRSMQIL